MLTHSGSFLSMIVIDELGSVLHFPTWWYGLGFLGVLHWMKRGLTYRWKKYSLGLWIRNFFVPMYGEYSLSGRMMSIFMRFVVIIGRSVAFFAEAWAYLFLGAFWIGLPIVSMIMLGRFFLEAFVRLV